MVPSSYKKYQYSPLPRSHEGRHYDGMPIRLLILFPGGPDAAFLGSLIVRTTEEYEALSYTWGTKSESPPSIGILRVHEILRMPITENLASAMRNLRHPTETRRLWVDALCINQLDDDEKSQQIPLMGMIYSRAENVCIYLGDNSANTSLAFDHIRSSKFMTSYLKRLQAVTWLRKLIKTERDGRLGLSPRTVKLGDKICILRGCSVPVVLRYIGQSNSQAMEQATENFGSPYIRQNNIRTFPSARAQYKKIRFEERGPYRLIGECYVHGVMDGEAFKIRDEHQLKEMEIEIH